MWIRKRLDLTAGHLLRGFAGGGSRQAAVQRIERCWRQRGATTLPTLSVRSGWDLFLSSMAYPAGSEIVMSAVSLPAMAEIARQHGLVVVPWDVDPWTAGPRAASLRELISDRTRAILVAHLFGQRMDLREVVEIADAYDVPVIEDAAQAYLGPDFVGSPGAALSMFSFGPIKTATALGGAVLQIRRRDWVAPMLYRHGQWPRLSNWHWRRRVARFAVLKMLSSRFAYSTVVRLLSWWDRDWDAKISRSARGFGPRFDPGLLRHQPSTGQLNLLAWRNEHFDGRRFQVRVSKARWLVQQLREEFCFPGQEVSGGTHWIVPILVEEPQRLARGLRDNGFDATTHASLGVIGSSSGANESLLGAVEWMSHVVYLPDCERMPFAEVDRLVECIRRFGSPMLPARPRDARSWRGPVSMPG